ncbi:hypothetical protein PCH_Pc21g04350 [Penicillium rubens Wisconsin 54-1255]|uniref:Uncharacterized protein n=1 Tax=Penicillium rubens (strain ATCC 28089 / DSM 1075 / NRRL 1951 / Wisconsin 54-1255) TaxID=500485 RepID=B6HMA8_PENRW|nr:hypothetical protein PCH_Pc21g04350 [Penicillium rubens Wisconsin 54-1255]
MGCQIHNQQSPIARMECGVGPYVTVLESGLGMDRKVPGLERREGREETAWFVWVLTIDKMSTGKQRPLFNQNRLGDSGHGIPSCLWHALHVMINSSHSPGFSGISMS